LVKRIAGICAVAFALAWALSLGTGTASANGPDPLIDPAQGAAGSRFQIVGQIGWTPGATVTISYGFSDLPPGDAYAGPFWNEQRVTVLRDGTWSFPTVVNDRVLPFPLWRPGYIVVRAASGDRVAVNSYLYLVDGHSPAGLPPLASFGFGPGDRGHGGVVALTVALFAAATGALLAMGGAFRRHEAA